MLCTYCYTEDMENKDRQLETHRRMFRVLQRAWLADNPTLTAADHVACCRRLLAGEDSYSWVEAALRVSRGDYPRGEQVKPVSSWHGQRTRGIHAALVEAVRLYGLGVSKRAVHASFWKFCFTHAARVPQELEHEETQQLVAMWVDAHAHDPNHARLAPNQERALAYVH